MMLKRIVLHVEILPVKGLSSKGCAGWIWIYPTQEEILLVVSMIHPAKDLLLRVNYLY